MGAWGAACYLTPDTLLADNLLNVFLRQQLFLLRRGALLRGLALFVRPPDVGTG
jgi:hypothetical protein